MVLFLSLTLLMSTPATTPSLVRAVNQSGVTDWSPNGPRQDNLVITVYSDFQTMFDAFVAGKVDITDWNVQPGDISRFCNNPDFFCTSPEPSLLMFQLNINQHGSFLGIAQQQTRLTSTPGIKNTVTSAGCSTGFGQLVVNLHNNETSGKPLILDSLNQLTLVGAVAVAPVPDSGGTTSNGQYVFPCTLAGTYTLGSTVYAGTAGVFIGSGQRVTTDFYVNYNSASTLQPSPAGIQINKAVSHLIDTKSFVNDPTVAGLVDNPHFMSSAQGYNNVCDNPVGGTSGFSKICQANLSEDCGAHTWLAPCTPAGPYDLSSLGLSASSYWWAAYGQANGVGPGYPSPADLRATCDHFVLAGFTVVGGTCLDVANALTGTTPTTGSYAHLNNNGQQIIEYLRSHPPRKHFGIIVADAINALFGTPNNGGVSGPGPQPGGTCTINYGILTPAPGCAPHICTIITQCFDIIFSPYIGGADDWKLFTGGFSQGFLGDDTYFEFNSQFSAGICAGPVSTYANDYTLYCDPAFDTMSHAGEVAANSGLSSQFFKRGFLKEYRDAFVVPVYNFQFDPFVALNGWNWQPGPQASLVSQLGDGFLIGFQSLLNMRCNPNFTPANPAFACGGGTAGLIRRGFSQDVHKVSWYTFQSIWDAEVLSQIYDSMLVANPRTGGASLQLIDWQTTSHSASFDPNEVSCTAPSQGIACLPGTTTQVWHLTPGLKFQDNFPLTADDVCFSIQSFRDVPSSNLVPNVAAVTEDNAGATVHQSGCKVNSATTLTVKLQGQSPFFESEIGLLPIVPKHLWAPVCGTFPFPQPNKCADPAFDAMAVGIEVGDGPWECPNINTGVIGGSCTQNADGSTGTQDVVLGGRIFLTRFEGFHACCSNVQGTTLQKISWADKNKDGVVNIFDIADAALHFGSDDPYWDHPLFGTTDGKVDIGEIATIAFYFEHGTTKPFIPSALTALDPAIDPFVLASGTTSGYYQGATSSAGITTIAIQPGSTPCTGYSGRNFNHNTNTQVGPTASFGIEGSSADCIASFNLTPGSYDVSITDTANNVTFPSIKFTV